MARFSVIVINFNKWHTDKDGGYPEQFEIITEANTEAEALNTFKTAYAIEGYEVQAHTVLNIGEYADRKAKAEADYKVREEAEAEAMGITVKEYRNKKKNDAKICKIKREIAEMERELNRKKEYLAKLTAKV